MCGGVLRCINLLIKRVGVRACPAFIRALSSVKGHVKLGPRVVGSNVGVRTCNWLVFLLNQSFIPVIRPCRDCLVLPVSASSNTITWPECHGTRRQNLNG